MEAIRLTKRERQVLDLSTRGYKLNEIASRLSISPLTVTTHRKTLYKKLDVHNVAQLIEKFAQIVKHENQSNMETEKLELNAVVELFGHQRMAGKVTEQTVGSTTFIRIDVPETERQPKFSRLLNPSAIYAINPVTEEVMKHMAGEIQNKPIEAWDVREMQKKLLELNQAAKKEPVHQGDEYDEDDELGF